MITVIIKNKDTSETKEYEFGNNAYGFMIALSHLYYKYKLKSGDEAFSSIRISDGKWEIINNLELNKL